MSHRTCPSTDMGRVSAAPVRPCNLALTTASLVRPRTAGVVGASPLRCDTEAVRSPVRYRSFPDGAVSQPIAPGAVGSGTCLGAVALLGGPFEQRIVDERLQDVAQHLSVVSKETQRKLARFAENTCRAPRSLPPQSIHTRYAFVFTGRRGDATRRPDEAAVARVAVVASVPS